MAHITAVYKEKLFAESFPGRFRSPYKSINHDNTGFSFNRDQVLVDSFPKNSNDPLFDISRREIIYFRIIMYQDKVNSRARKGYMNKFINGMF